MLYPLPQLRTAMRDGSINYEQARVIASHATDETVDEWIRRAQGMTCIALRRQIEAEHEAQICARGELELRVPTHVYGLLGVAIRAARKAESKWISNSMCLRRIAEHCIGVWKTTLKQRSTVQRRVLKRDKGFCQVPGCSRAAVHAHHIIPRAQGGSDDPSNLVSLCAAHHLHGIHGGYIRVTGKAPDQLRWELGLRLRPREGKEVRRAA
jgi:5-methylcytosine-specific restriction endonuclease McrA